MKKVTQGFNKYNTLDLKILRIELVSNEVVDLSNSFVELEIYRDVFSLGMTGSLIFNDVLNITNNGPILGGERVYAMFKSPLYDDYTELMFRVSLVKEREPLSQGVCVVKLELCSEALYFGLSKSISIGYEGQYSKLAQTLWEALEIDSEFKYDETCGIHLGCTTHDKNVIETIKRLAKRSVCSDRVGFTYFEDYDGGVFASWKRMLSQTAAQKMILQAQGTEETILKDWMNIMAIQFDSDSRDALEFMRRGVANRVSNLFSTDTKTNESLSKSLDELTDNYKLDAGSIKVKDSDRSSRVYNHVINGDDAERSISDSINLDSLLNYNNTTILNVGDNKARLGQLVELKLPAPQLPDPKNPKMEQFFSGKYIVLGIKDTIRPNEYRTYRRLTKESLLNEV